MEKKIIKLNEQYVQKIITESVKKHIKEMHFDDVNKINEDTESENDDVNEEDMEEGFWDNLKTGTKTFFSNKRKGQGLRNRFQRAKQNFNNQAEYDNANELLNKIKQFIQLYNQKQDELVARNGWDKRYASTFKIKNSTTVGELLGYTKRNGEKKMGKVSQSALNTKKEINKLLQ